MPDSEVEVRSYRAVFSLDRRIYRIDTLRLNPSGVPLRGLAYAATLVAIAVAVRGLPGVSWLVAPLPWYLGDLACPLALAALLVVLRIEGRPFHLAAGALLLQWSGPRYLASLERRARSPRFWRPSSIVCIVDGSDGAPRAMRYRGPGVVLIGYAHDRVDWAPGLTRWRRTDISLHPRAEGPLASPVALELAKGAVLEVSSRPLRSRDCAGS